MPDEKPKLPPRTWRSRAEMMSARAVELPKLEHEANSGLRLLFGIGCFVLALAGALLVGTAIDYTNTHGSDSGSTSGLVVGTPLLVAGLVLGAIVWRSGRAVNNALFAWEELPDHIAPDGSRVDEASQEAMDADTLAELAQRRRQQWITNRTRLYTPQRVGRLALGALAGLAALASILYVLVGPGWEDAPAAGLAMGFVLAATTVIVFGGQLRFGASLSRRDWRLRKTARTRRVELGGPEG